VRDSGLDNGDGFRQQERHDGEPEHPDETGNPEQPEQNAAGREDHAERRPPPPPAVVRGCRGSGGSPPDRFKPDGQEPQAEQVRRRPPQFEREPEHAQHVDRSPAEGEVADKRPDPPLPEAGPLGADRDDPITLGVIEAAASGHENHATQEERESRDQDGQQIGEHDLAQQQRPREDQECADAAEAEDRNGRQPEPQAHADHAEPVNDRAHRVRADPGACAGRRAPEEALRAVAESREGGDEEQDFERPALAHLPHQEFRRLPGLPGSRGRAVTMARRWSRTLSRRLDMRSEGAVAAGVAGTARSVARCSHTRTSGSSSSRTNS
jgi:hypothetical protein